MTNRLLCAILLLLMIAPTAAQDTAPFPVLDEAAIFADGVTVIERLPVLNLDNTARKLYYFNPEESIWETYDYPEGINDLGFMSVTDRIRNFYLLSTRIGDTFVAPIDSVWLFDAPNGQILRPESQCGRVKAEFGMGQWVLERDEQTGSFYFCHTETENTTSPLSPEISELCERSMNDVLFSKLYTTSPNGEWVVFTDCNQTYNQSDFGYRIFAYNPTSETYRILGETAQFESIRFARWLNDTTLIIHGYTLGTQHSRYVYLVDVTQEKSLTLVAEQYVTNPQYFSDPERYIWFGWDTQNVYEYNLETRQSRQISDVGCESIFSFCVAIPNPDYTLIAVEDVVWQSILPGHINIYTMSDSELIYSLETENPSGFDETDRSVVWLDNSRLLANGYLIDAVESTKIAHFSYLNPDWLSPDKLYLATWGETDRDELNIVRLSDFNRISLTTNLNSENFEIRVEKWLSTSELEIAVYYVTEWEFTPIASWRIHIDALDEENS